MVDEKNEMTEIWEVASDIFANATIFEMNKYIHHRHSTVYEHSLYVTRMSIRYADFLERLHIKIDRKSLIRGALLHDFFLYDWRAPKHKLHGFKHAGIAYQNAIKLFKINKIERDIIKKHMFPLTPIPPTKRESIIVCIADKVCAIYEYLGSRYKGNLI